MKRELLLEQNYGYRIPFPEEVHTNPDIKKKNDRYQSRIQYAFPYDPHIEGKTAFYLKNMKEFNPDKSWSEVKE